MKKKILALLLAAVMVSTFVGTAIASADDSDAGLSVPAETTQTPAAEGETGGEVSGEAVTGSTTETSVETTPETTDPVLEEEELQEATDEMLLFVEVEDLVKKYNESYDSLLETIAYMEELEKAADKLESSIADLDDLLALLQANPELSGTEAVGFQTIETATATRAQLQQQLTSVSSMVQDTSTMESGCHQIVKGAETLFIALVGMEQQEVALERQLAALDRTVEEMKVRQEWGQISELQLMEVESGRGSLVSGLTTLRMNIFNYKMQLEQMVGEDMTGKIQLGTLPAVTADQLNAINVEEDLKKVLRRSYDVIATDNARDKADSVSMPGMKDALENMQDAAHHSYLAAREQVELSFRMLCAQVQDQRQVLAAAETALETEELAYQAAKLKYEHGTISHNALLTAQDELKTAQEAVKTAKNDLFSYYNNYRWAVDHGILS